MAKQSKQQLSIREYTVKYGRSVPKTYQSIWGGRLPATRVDGRWVIDGSKLDQNGFVKEVK